jgi:capsular polysaccharide biosynthesis protein
VNVNKRTIAEAVIVSLFVGWLVMTVSRYTTPKYEASVVMLVGQKGTGASGLQDVALTVAKAVPTMPVAKAVVEQLNLPKGSAREVLENMSVEHKPGTARIDITYTDSEAKRTQLVANAIGRVVTQKIGEMNLGNNEITATVREPATLPETPVSPKPLRNGLIALVATLALSAVLIASGRGWFRL